MEKQIILKIVPAKSSKGTLYNRIILVINGIELPVQLDYTTRSILEQLIKG